MDSGKTLVVLAHDEIVRQTRSWVEQLVIAQNLCPFAKLPYEQGRVRFIVSEATRPEQLLGDLLCELRYLDTIPAKHTETTLIVHPHMLQDFDDYNAFLGIAEQLIKQEGFSGIIQIASFHPQYCFAGVDVQDASHYTNRSPFPMLHLIREDSLAKAIQHHPDVEGIPARNIAVMRQLGADALQSLLQTIQRG